MILSKVGLTSPLLSTCATISCNTIMTGDLSYSCYSFVSFTCEDKSEIMILELLNRVCKALDENGFPYMISGSIALNVYAIPRMTRDIDIVIELPIFRIDEFVKLFPNSYLNKATIIEEVKKQGLFNIIDHDTGFKLDFIPRKDTDYFKHAFSRRKKISELETELWVISLEDLIIAKFIWIQDYRGEQQLQDIENLLLDPDKDMKYIKEWCHDLGLNTFDLLENE